MITKEVSELHDRMNAGFQKIIDTHPLLSRKEERSLSRKIREGKVEKEKQKAREDLFKSNIRLALHHANYMSRHYSNIPLEDLIGAAMNGLMEAVDKFNSRKHKTRFSTYATLWVKQKVNGLIKVAVRDVYVPINVCVDAVKYEKKKEEGISDKDIKEELDLSDKGLNKVKLVTQTSSVWGKSLYLDATTENSNSGVTTSPMDFISNNERSADENAIFNERIKLVKTAMVKLSPIQKDIFEKRYFSSQRVNLETLGNKHNLSKERIRQIEVQAVKIVKRQVEKIAGKS